MMITLSFQSKKVECPLRILHAWKDEDVEWESSLNLLQKVKGLDTDLTIRKRGNHRLMKPTDLTLIIYTLDSLLKTLEDGAYVVSKL